MGGWQVSGQHIGREASRMSERVLLSMLRVLSAFE